MITKLQGENFKRIKAVCIHPKTTGATIIGGRNGQGKSSSLDIIQAVVGGKKHCPTKAIRDGERKSITLIETDKLKAVRVFTPQRGGGEKSAVTVESLDGASFGSPQELLNELWSPLTIDPLSFARKPVKEQAEILRAYAGLDFTKEDAARKAAYDKRTEAGREIKRLEGALAKLPVAPEDAVEVSVSELASELDRRQRINADHDERRRGLSNLRTAAEAQIKSADDLRKRLAAAELAVEKIRADGKALAAEVAGLRDEDLGEVRAQIANAEETNKAARATTARRQLEAELGAQADASATLSAKIDQIDGVKSSAIAAAKYPLLGLSVTEDGWALDGIPGEQVCQSGQLKISIAIAIALNPGRVLLAREGSFLDDEGLRLLDEMCTAAGVQALVEVVGKREGMMVVIEDGEVADG